MNLSFRIGLLSLCLFSFQNCGEFRAASLGLVYPYSSKPDFFYDIKLVSIETNEYKNQIYIVDVAASSAVDPQEASSYVISFSTPERSGICAPKSQQAVGAEKHKRYTCILPTSSKLNVTLTLQGASGEEAIEQYQF